MKTTAMDWPSLIFWGVFGWIMGSLVAGLLSCLPAAVTPQQAEEISLTATRTETCKAEGRKHNSYSAYDCCMKLAGLHPGAACTSAAPPTVLLPYENPYFDGGSDGPK